MDDRLTGSVIARGERASQRLSMTPVYFVIAFAELDQFDGVEWSCMILQPFSDRTNRYLSGLLYWISINAGADRREAHGFHVKLDRQVQAGEIAGSEQLTLLMLAAAIKWTDGMKDVFRG
jgi:hypothetical protein